MQILMKKIEVPKLGTKKVYLETYRNAQDKSTYKKEYSTKHKKEDMKQYACKKNSINR